VGDQAIVPASDQVAGTSNVLFALPSMIVNAWRNAQVLAEMVGAGVAPAGTPTQPAPRWGGCAGRLSE
jgi:hypothetical protein